MGHEETARFLSWTEGILFIGWMILMGFGHAQGSAQCRANINALTLHFLFTGIVLFVAMFIYTSKQKEYLHWGHCAAFLLAIAIDVNNLLEVVLHNPCTGNIWYGTVVMAGVFIAVSFAVFVWYVSLIWKHKYRFWIYLHNQEEVRYHNFKGDTGKLFK